MLCCSVEGFLSHVKAVWVCTWLWQRPEWGIFFPPPCSRYYWSCAPLQYEKIFTATEALPGYNCRFQSPEKTKRQKTSDSPVEHTNTLYSPMTLLANDVRIKVASPRSPIFTEPVGPVMKMLSHFRSRWMIGGVLVCRKCSPFKICRHQLLKTFGFMTLKRFKYLEEAQHNFRQSRSPLHSSILN